MTLAFYFTRRFFWSFIRVFLAIALLISLIDLFENLGRMNTTSDPFKNALVLTFLRAPNYISLALPLIVMLSSLSFCIGLARSSEFVISRAAGQSALKSLFAPMLCAFVIGVFSVFVYEPFAGRIFETYDKKADAFRGQTTQAIAVNEDGYWLRQPTQSGHQIIKAVSASGNGSVLNNVLLYDYDDDGVIVSRVHAQTAVLKDGEWLFSEGTRWEDAVLTITPEKAAEPFQILRVATSITPSQILSGYPAPQSLSPIQIPSQIDLLEASGFSAKKYQIHQASQYARPILFAVMMLIGAVFTLQTARLGNIGISVMSSILFGFSLHFLTNFAKTLGSSGDIPIAIAAFSPTIAAGLLAITLFLHLEDG